MEGLTTKCKIGSLDGSNWPTWKYKACILLSTCENALEVCEGKILEPVLRPGGGDAAVTAYNAELAKFKQADKCALLVLTNNMTEETLTKVMRFKMAREVWEELHRLYDGQSENSAYRLCLEFFDFKHNQQDSVDTLMSKLKNIWTALNAEIIKEDASVKL